jgi:hypothetical protein
MTLKTTTVLIFSLFISIQLQAQQLLILNGGSFGSSTDIANLGIYNPNISNSFLSIDSIGVTSVQDLLVETEYVYVAAADSLIRYDLAMADGPQRVAAANFGAVSTVHLEIYGTQLLVGNYYGANQGNLRIFNKSDLSFVDSIPEITLGAKDFLVIGDTAYITQNNSTSSFQDTLGYLAIVDLNTGSFVRYDTLGTAGEELGRLVNVGDSAIYALNPVSNTISYYNINTAQSNVYPTAININVRSVGGTIYQDNNLWYFPYDNGIGSYDLINNTVGTADIISIPANFSGYAFAMDTVDDKFYLSYIDYANQTNNQGIAYDMTGDSIGTFPVGSSPEVLEVYYEILVGASNNASNQMTVDVQLFPNPARDYFQLKTEGILETVELFDLQGRLVKQWANSQNQYFNIAELQAGQYFIRIQTTEGRTTKILIKQ